MIVLRYYFGTLQIFFFFEQNISDRSSIGNNLLVNRNVAILVLFVVMMGVIDAIEVHLKVRTHKVGTVWRLGVPTSAVAFA